MKNNNKRTPSHEKMQRSIENFFTIVLFILFATTFYLAISFTPLTKEMHMDRYGKMKEDVEPFRRNLTECARQVKANQADVENFLKRIPQSSMQGKCFVACILKRNLIIMNNKINKNRLLELNSAVYGENSEVMPRLKIAIKECSKVVSEVFEVCDYASMFNDCMHIKMEHILDRMMMEQRMEAVSKMTSDPEEWGEEEDEMLQLVRDEL